MGRVVGELLRVLQALFAKCRKTGATCPFFKLFGSPPCILNGAIHSVDVLLYLAAQPFGSLKSKFNSPISIHDDFLCAGAGLQLQQMQFAIAELIEHLSLTWKAASPPIFRSIFLKQMTSRTEERS